MKHWLFGVLGLAAVITACANGPGASPEPPLNSQSVVGLSGDLGAHDPVMFKAGTTYCLMSTGIDDAANPGGVLVHKSSGGLSGAWSTLGAIPVPGWAKADYQVHNIWAPEVVQGGDGRYYLYYAASQFGTKNSAIGVATSTDPCAAGTWTDLGPILRSGANTDYNAIDPSVFWDGSSWWMTWGSFFGGIKLQRMSSMTTFTGPVYTLASRPGVSNNPLEASSVMKRGNWYYLFLSWDGCCNGVNSTYKTVVGRATSITGPYLDKNGVALDQGGGTIVLGRRGNKIGQGGGDVFTEGSTNFFVHHYYDANSGGSPKFDVKALEWNGNWPYSSESTPGYDLVNGGVYRLVNEKSSLCLDVENGQASPTAQIRQWGCNNQSAQNFRLEQTSDGFHRLRSLLGNQDLCLDIENGSSTPGADVRLWSCNNLFAQNWHLEDMGNGFHRLIGEQTRLALDNVNGNTTWGNEVRTWSINGFSPQNWRLERR